MPNIERAHQPQMHLLIIKYYSGSAMKNEDILTSGFEVNGENRRMGMLTKACKLFSSRFRIF